MTINKHLSSQPHIGGALPLNQQQNLERRNRGLSLLNQTAAHCISPSECCNDYYNNDSFNEIKLQLHASSKVSNPYSFNITKDIGFSATCTSKNTITITVGTVMYPSLDGTDNTKQYYYGYSRNRDTGNPDYGECSPSTYHGIEIFDIYILIVVQDTIQGPNTTSMFYMNFAKHVNINKITINDSTYSIDSSGNNHDDDASYGCIYAGIDQDIVGFNSLKEYFINNVGKQITITLE